ncbi:hypothetical protein MRB53_041079 [Persea americana]|nr:hypothetical protein MRB53_041079 [Persea americana]
MSVRSADISEVGTSSAPPVMAPPSLQLVVTFSTLKIRCEPLQLYRSVLEKYNSNSRRDGFLGLADSGSDGGGVRGYSIFILLEELMHRLFVEIHGRAPRPEETPKPCDHFDLIAGIGTGGLIAIMLGRLRLDLETCKDVYVRMTKRVFETDKRIAGIPYRSTLFKASKLEEAIMECVKEHTVYDDEGNDTLGNAQVTSPGPGTPISATSSGPPNGPRRSQSSASRASVVSPMSRGVYSDGAWGNPNALLYDTRENRTKTAVAAVYKGTPLTGSSILLRSYDSRNEPIVERRCTIWQAGRATCATALAFKPIQVGQSIFLDEGASKYNPSPQILDEATINEWPGREVGAFVSIGTGKRPPGTSSMSSQWWEGFMSSGIGDFAEARRRLVAKIEGCEETHRQMLSTHLRARQVDPANYFRLNVEVGVGEFGMNEWNRLTDISTNTHMYLRKPEVQATNNSAAAKMARIHKAKQRWSRASASGVPMERRMSWEGQSGNGYEVPPPSHPLAIELPAEVVYQGSRPPSEYRPQSHHSYQSSVTADDKFAVLDAEPAERQQYLSPVTAQHHGHGHGHGHYDDVQQQRRSWEASAMPPPPPPVPPKMPMVRSVEERRYEGQYRGGVPYPERDMPPPPVNMARKPDLPTRQ